MMCVGATEMRIKIINVFCNLESPEVVKIKKKIWLSGYSGEPNVNIS